MVAYILTKVIKEMENNVFNNAVVTNERYLLYLALPLRNECRYKSE